MDVVDNRFFGRQAYLAAQPDPALPGGMQNFPHRFRFGWICSFCGRSPGIRCYFARCCASMKRWWDVRPGDRLIIRGKWETVTAVRPCRAFACRTTTRKSRAGATGWMGSVSRLAAIRETLPTAWPFDSQHPPPRQNRGDVPPRPLGNFLRRERQQQRVLF